MLAHFLGYGNPTEHTGKFFRAFRFREHSDCRGGFVFTGLLLDQVVPFAVTGYLGEVRNADDLVSPREFL